MPKIKVPPDKKNSDNIFKHKEVSQAVNSLFSSQRSQTLLPLEERVSKSLLPSNLDGQVSAENLKKELLGKSIKVIDICNKNTILVQDQSRKVQSKVNKEKVQSKSDFKYQESEDLKFILPPSPKREPVAKPDFIDIVSEVRKLLHQSSSLSKPKVIFEVSPLAAYKNYFTLLKAGFDLDKVLDQENSRSVTSYGSEFKAVDDLDNLMRLHPRWPKLRKRLIQGSNWLLNDILESERQEDLDLAVTRGNHKSAVIHKKFLAEALEKEVKKGWILALPLEKATSIPHLTLSPMGVVEQLGINEHGDFVPKRRITHDLSFPGQSSNSSINSRVVEDVLEPCLFGHAMLRIIHWIIHLRSLHPSKKIWIRKEDAKSAYRRMHLHAKTVTRTGVQISFENFNYLLLSLRLPFGGSPCPSEFCLLSDLLTDAINDLMACECWDPNELHSDYLEKIPSPTSLPSDIPFEQAKDLSVKIPEGDICKADVFIDDIITMGVDTKDYLRRIMAGPSTIMHAFTHTASGDIHVPRQDFIAEDKNAAEGGPDEVKIVLGWKLNTRSLTVHLPFHKFKAWSDQVTSIKNRRSINSKDLQSVLGRLENIAIMIPMFAHFLNNIRALEIKATISGKNQVLNNRTKTDLNLALKFIEKAHKGVNMNNITFRSPTKVYINDASEHGLGGFASHGRAWSYTIPEKLRGRAHINLLEFIAQLVSIWLDKIEGKLDKQECLLAMGDNTASMGWLRRSNFRENEEHDTEWLAKQSVARKVAEIILDSDTCLYRQWFKGEDNALADSLSRDGFIFSHQAHKKFLNITIPSQVPQDFNIYPLPKEISLFISSILLQLPVKKQRLKLQKPSDLVLSNVGLLSSLVSTSILSTWKNSPDFNKISSCQHLHKPSVKPPSLTQIKLNWWKERSVPPSHMWHRPSGQTIGQTRDWTLTVKPVSCYKNNYEGIATRMADDENRKHSQ